MAEKTSVGKLGAWALFSAGLALAILSLPNVIPLGKSLVSGRAVITILVTAVNQDAISWENVDLHHVKMMLNTYLKLKINIR